MTEGLPSIIPQSSPESGVSGDCFMTEGVPVIPQDSLEMYVMTLLHDRRCVMTLLCPSLLVLVI